MEDTFTALSLYHSVLQGDWNAALTTYIENPSMHETPINSSGDTVLHEAVNDDKEDTVAKLVEAIKGNGSWSALKKNNDREGTPLHCAASSGSRNMCMCIAEAQGGDELLVARNKEGETPLFLAALNGHKDAFLYLHHRCPDHYSRLWRRTGDGKTVLHCTISREHFELAFQIILLYKEDIVGSMDGEGMTPLHILAGKPSCFESSSNFRWYNKLLYNCIIVKPLTASLDQQSNDNDTLLSWRIKSSPRTQTGADAEDPSYYGFENVVPPNYRTCYDIFARLFTCFIRPVVETLGLQDVEHLKKKKEKHVWCRQILDQLWKYDQAAYVGGVNALQRYAVVQKVRQIGFPKPGGDKNKNANSKDDGGNQNQQKGKGKKNEEWDRNEPALFTAAKNGVLEILKKIMKDERGAIRETNTKGQNVLHVVVEYRQPHVFNLFKELLSKQRLWDNLVQSQDNEGNTVLHLAARLSKYKPWHSPGSALQMQWEMKWFLYIKDITPAYMPFLPNNDHETPLEIFRKDHEGLVKEGTKWLNHTSAPCSVVATLIASVAFATSTTIPGGTREETVKPYLERRPAFNMFALTSVLAFCCSITSLTMFLAIVTSRHQPLDFRKDLPLKLFLGLSSLFISVASILVSFSAAFFLELEHSPKQVVFLLYAATILPFTFYALGQYPLYTDLVKAIFSKVPQAGNRESEKLIL